MFYYTFTSFICSIELKIDIFHQKGQYPADFWSTKVGCLPFPLTPIKMTDKTIECFELDENEANVEASRKVTKNGQKITINKYN